jgi:hypothetical protein
MIVLNITIVSSLEAAPKGASIDFKRDIAPLLEAHCTKCHGKTKRKGGLRLSNKRDAFLTGDDGAVTIKPGDAANSKLFARLTSKDEDERMPPKGGPLPADKIQLIKRWIDSGAQWPEADGASKHWAYIKPIRSALPAVKNKQWAKNGIDAFILARLESMGLKPSTEADRARLLRRVSLDLIGLPPTPAQTAAFINDKSPNAYEKVVDRLLASKRYGEHWARHWLDLARYADSNGFQADQIRDSWAYRDWVINAFNAHMPFDQFTIEQIAGDLLPDATADQRIATGFHRTVTCNVEAGVHPEENRTNQVMDRVSTTGTVWLGTTLECAQCHNHKYDPFSTKDYYQFFAYFNNTPLEVKQTGGVSYDFVGPKMSLPLPAIQLAKRKELQAKYDALATQYKKSQSKISAGQKQWEAKTAAALGTAAQWHVLPIKSFEATGGESHKLLDDHSVLIGGNVPGTTNYTIKIETKLSDISAFKIEALTDASLPGKGPGRGDETRPNFILSELSITAGPSSIPNAAKNIKLISPQADYSQARWEVGKAIDGNQKTGWAIAGQFHKPHWASFIAAKPIATSADQSSTLLTFSLDQNHGGGRTIGRVRLSALTGDPDGLSLPKNIIAILAKTKKRTRKEQKQISDYYLKANPQAEKLKKQMADMKRQINRFTPPTTLIMVEMDKPRKTNIMIRGDYLDLGAAVTTGTPATLQELNPKLPKNRLGLAKWLVDPANPLVGRVTVNRMWAQIMGQGIVATQEDFGTQCDPPTHPKLLDWLATEFIEKGWSLQHIQKLIVMSATYRQSSKLTASLLDKDPRNLFYARGPRIRMSAEMIRDNALTISGLLSDKMGGPPVFPPQPDGLWRQTGRNEPKYVVATNEDRYRRGVYIIWRRAAPYASFVNFDGPDRASCVPARGRTNTPLQALTLLNDEAYVEMALALADRVLRERPKSDIDQQIAYAFGLTLARKPGKEETDHLKRLYEQQLARFKADPKAAATLIDNVKNYKPSKQANRAQLAAWFYLANVLLNLDETITKG